MTEIDPVEFGALKAELAAQRRDLDRMATQLSELASSVQRIERTISEARGGWRAIAWVAGFSGTLGAGVSWVLNHLPAMSR
jgi:hypothetical protein